eukprot:TRINITY_DN5384_c0_g2_i1.p1 TRINITY_DN5384_c0_g2~~TRINITY_DN5384_c0_g2_i1.p1  ORF type:complete len:542 (+),score=207.32 TRINITY_DN5384_c0_g2_i1:62-1687(+)
MAIRSTAPRLASKIVLTGEKTMTLNHLRDLANGMHNVKVEVSKKAAANVKRARGLVDYHVKKGNIVYGLTTGFGKLKNVAIAEEDLADLQTNLVLSHCCGVGEAMPVEEVRLTQILRLQGLTQGHSGVRPELIDFLVDVFNKRFVPFIPQKGSVGASGDLAPLSHMTAAYMGQGKAFVPDPADPSQYKLMNAWDALQSIGHEPIELTAKEGLAMINGTEIMKSTAVVTTLRAEQLILSADGIGALSLEALNGTATPFDDRLAVLKGCPGHRATSHNFRACLSDSQVLKSHTKCDRVQDPYSLRCMPIVHGQVKAAFGHVHEVVSRELNSVTDNPILFPETKQILSAGHFHGMPISMSMDYLSSALCTLANISERRTEQLVNPDLSGMPGFLCPHPGLHSGYMIAQVAAAALCSENKVLAHPASVDTIPTSANQEDHVSMGTHSARKARTILENTESVLSVEMLCAAQGREFNKKHKAGRGAQAVYKLTRSVIPPLEGDRFTYTDMEAALALIRDGKVRKAMEAKCALMMSYPCDKKKAKSA